MLTRRSFTLGFATLAVASCRKDGADEITIGANSKKFIDAYRAKYKRDPSSIAAQGYDAARILFDAIGRATEPKPEPIRKALVETKDFPGATGTMSFDAERNANKPIVIVEIRNKKLTYKTQLLATDR